MKESVRVLENEKESNLKKFKCLYCALWIAYAVCIGADFITGFSGHILTAVILAFVLMGPCIFLALAAQIWLERKYLNQDSGEDECAREF